MSSYLDNVAGVERAVEWFEEARKHIQAAKRLAGQRGLELLTIFHLQQAMEMAVQGLASVGNRQHLVVPMETRKAALKQSKRAYAIRHEVDRFQTPLQQNSSSEISSLLRWRCETRFTPRGVPQIAGAVVEPDAAAGLKSPGYHLLLAETGSGLVLRPGGRGFAGDP